MARLPADWDRPDEPSGIANPTIVAPDPTLDADAKTVIVTPPPPPPREEWTDRLRPDMVYLGLAVVTAFVSAVLVTIVLALALGAP